MQGRTIFRLPSASVVEIPRLNAFVLSRHFSFTFGLVNMTFKFKFASVHHCKILSTWNSKHINTFLHFLILISDTDTRSDISKAKYERPSCISCSSQNNVLLKTVALYSALQIQLDNGSTTSVVVEVRPIKIKTDSTRKLNRGSARYD